MKKIITTVILLLAIVNIFAKSNDVVTLTCSGSAKTEAEAINVALRSAIEQTYGAFISSNTRIINDKLVKDEITYQLIEDRLKKDDCKNGFIIDGFPRNLEQAIEYDKILAKLGYDVGNVFLLNIDVKKLEKRITGRRICEDCQAIYNINDEVKAPQVESVCDKCGGKLYQRKDDNLESFQTRFAMYQEKTEPIIEHYRKQNVLHEIDSNHEFDEVFRQIDEIISKN